PRPAPWPGPRTTAPPRACTPRTPTTWSSRSPGWSRPICSTRRPPPPAGASARSTWRGRRSATAPTPRAASASRCNTEGPPDSTGLLYGGTSSRWGGKSRRCCCRGTGRARSHRYGWPRCAARRRCRWTRARSGCSRRSGRPAGARWPRCAGRRCTGRRWSGGARSRPAARPSWSAPSSRSSPDPTRRSSRACRPGPWRRPRPPRPSNRRRRPPPSPAGGGGARTRGARRGVRGWAPRGGGGGDRGPVGGPHPGEQGPGLVGGPLDLGLLGLEPLDLGGLGLLGRDQVALALLEGLAGQPQLVHQVAVVRGQQVEHLDAGDGGGRGVRAEHGRDGAAGALDVGRGRPGPEARLELAQVVLGAIGLGVEALEGLADLLQSLVSLVCLLV